MTRAFFLLFAMVFVSCTEEVASSAPATADPNAIVSNCTQGCPAAQMCDETMGTCVANPCGLRCTRNQVCVRFVESFGADTYQCCDQRGQDCSGRSGDNNSPVRTR